MSKHKSAFWSFFSSVQLTIVLLSIIAFIAVVGTLIPQQDGARDIMQQMSPGLVSFLQMMQVFDLYHSIWFFLLMGLLSINLIVCSLNRFPASWQRFRARSTQEESGVFKSLAPENMVHTQEDQKTVSEWIYPVIKRRFRNLRKQETAQGTYFHGDKGRYAHLGVYVVHVSILILIVGAVAGSLFGVEGYVNISEGETIGAIALRGAKGSRSLPFSVRCDRFTIEFYENGAPKTYRSDLTFLKNNQVAYQGPLLVNHPISFDGFRFYQASYGQSPQGRALITFMKEGHKAQVMSVATGDVFDLPPREGRVQVLRIEENLMKMGPAVKLGITSPQGETSFWIFKQIDRIKEMNPGIIEQVPLFNPGLFQPYIFAMKGMEEKYFTGLQVAKDPGVPLVITAAFFMVLGLMVVFFSSHRQVWVRVEQEAAGARVSIAGRSHKNAAGLEREINGLLAAVRERVESGA